MTNPFLNNKNTIFRGSRVLIPFFSNLNTWYKKIVGTIFNEKINNLPARFLPRVGLFNGTDKKTVYSGSEIGDIINIKIKYSDGTWATVTDLVSGSTTVSGLWDITGTDLTIGYDGANWLTGQIAWVEGYDSGSNLIFSSHISGQGDHEYELVNENHGLISGTGSHYDFDLNGSTRPNDGHSIWRKAANPDIQVQFDVNGAALSLTAGVNIPAGYSHERDVPAGGSNHNIYKSLVNFDPDGNGVAMNTSNLVNNDYTTFTGSGLTGFSATSNGGSTQEGGTADEILIDISKQYLVVFDAVLNSGIAPSVMFAFSLGGVAKTNTEIVVNGSNSFIFTPTVGSTMVFQFQNISTVTDYVISNLKIKLYEPNYILDREDATRQTATSRASEFYNSDYPFIYHIDELIDPQIYALFFKPDYQSIVFGVVKLLGSVPVLLKEFLNYATQKVGVELTKVTNYCGITDIYHVYGAELHTNANAASDPNENEANAITGFLNGQTLNVLQSQSSVKNVGSYAIEANANTNPVHRNRAFLDLNDAPFNCTTGKRYRISLDARHVGTGGEWLSAIGEDSSPTDIKICTLINTDIIFTTYVLEWDHNETDTRYWNFREDSGTNDGGVYFDNFSIKEIIL